MTICPKCERLIKKGETVRASIIGEFLRFEIDEHIIRAIEEEFVEHVSCMPESMGDKLVKRFKRWLRSVKHELHRIVTRKTIMDMTGKKDYLLRWSLWLPGGVSLKLHKIVRTDEDRCEHDHPWWFIRFILWGGYTESVNGKKYDIKPWRPWAPWRVYPCRPSFRHRIIHLPRKISWSFVICGKSKGFWGFYTKEGWIPWQQFITNVKRVLWCDDGR